MRKFIYGPGINEPICLVEVAENNAVYYYHFDGLGSVVALSDVNSVLVERYTYDVFGRPAIRDANGTEIAASAFANPYLFTGRAYDAETGLYYYRARYYDYATGRFLQPDPVAPYLQIAARRYANREEPTLGTYMSADSLGEFLESGPLGKFLRSDANGRFLRAAWFGMPVELNLYTYCNNSPIILLDPYGLGFWKDLWHAKGWVGGAGIVVGGLLYIAGLPVTGTITMVVGATLVVVEAYEYFMEPPGGKDFKKHRKQVEDKMDESPYSGRCKGAD